MGLFSNSREESEEIRGVPDSDLSKLPDRRLVFIAIARLFEAQGVDDEALIKELYSRGRSLSDYHEQ